VPLHPFTGRVLAYAALPLALLPVAARASTIDFPRQGVVCDLPARRCYTAQGVSLALTREFFGSYAERELSSTQSGNRRSNQFKLSDGDVCDLRQQTCWDDGRGGKNVSNALSRQLFGSNGAWGNNGSQQSAQGSRSCELRRGNRGLFDGSCQLNRRETSNGTAYNVELSDGRRYSFFNRDGRLVMRDANNVLRPAQISNRNGAVAFRWDDLQLSTRNPSWGNQGPQGSSSDFNPTSNFLQDVFSNLFR